MHTNSHTCTTHTHSYFFLRWLFFGSALRGCWKFSSNGKVKLCNVFVQSTLEPIKLNTVSVNSCLGILIRFPLRTAVHDSLNNRLLLSFGQCLMLSFSLFVTVITSFHCSSLKSPFPGNTPSLLLSFPSCLQMNYCSLIRKTRLSS